jgi:Fe-S cluster biosynthesis and repair protein YggX
MDINQRIAQFETMVRPEADPNNDMAWFSLGGAYSQAGRHADAAKAFIRCFEINPAMSKAYQLAGKALMEAGDSEQAGEVLVAGYKIAAGKGDLMPRRAMGEMLERLGVALPAVAERAPAAAPAGAIDGSFVCTLTGKPGTKMSRQPFKGPVGAWIQEHISQQTFDDWIKQGTKVINELRLDLSRDEDANTYDRHMRDYLGIDDGLLAQITSGSR